MKTFFSKSKLVFCGLIFLFLLVAASCVNPNAKKTEVTNDTVQKAVTAPDSITTTPIDTTSIDTTKVDSTTLKK